MKERIVLISANSPLRQALESAGFDVRTWPLLQIQPPESVAALDEALENLFGYDWIILVHEDAARAFIERLRQQGHEVSDLDALKVCAIGDQAATALEQARVHVDVVATSADPSAIVEQLASYAGGTRALDRLGVLIPQSTIGSSYLKEQLEGLGARADVVATYHTVASADLRRLITLQSMLGTGSVDAVVFANSGEVHDLARVFDAPDLTVLLGKTQIFTTSDDATGAIRRAGIAKPYQSSPDEVTELLATRGAG